MVLVLVLVFVLLAFLVVAGISGVCDRWWLVLVGLVLLVVYVLLVVPAVVLFHAPGLYTVPDIL